VDKITASDTKTLYCRGLGFFHTKAFFLKFPVRDQFHELKTTERHSSPKCVANIFWPPAAYNLVRAI